jgi:two-component system response regulator YesN
MGRLFKEETGSSFPTWLNRLRIEEAEKLMYAGGLTVSQIAIKVGYSNPNYFFSLFKKYKGRNPGDFIESIKKS